jgi:hypothetical protein
VVGEAVDGEMNLFLGTADGEDVVRASEVVLQGDAGSGLLRALVVDEELPATAAVLVLPGSELRGQRVEPVLPVVLRQPVAGAAAAGGEERG